jgi:GTP-dependent phosphoenolpyruvate carboxykinase
MDLKILMSSELQEFMLGAVQSYVTFNGNDLLSATLYHWLTTAKVGKKGKVSMNPPQVFALREFLSLWKTDNINVHLFLSENQKDIDNYLFQQRRIA